MNALVKFDNNTSLSAMTEGELVNVLQSSIYPGAKIESIKLVIGYCKAQNLDPIQKPVHIVPMPVSTGKKGSDGWDIKELRDTVMPGIGLYRTQAARTGEYAGVTEPEYGEDVVGELDGVKIVYPKWCKIIAKRLLPNGQVAEFSAKEFWIENYATKSNKSDAPNAMWKKRPYAQLAKCAEAQALRKGFPEAVGSQPTADEMEGKNFESNEIDITPKLKSEPEGKPALPDCSNEDFAANRQKWRGTVEGGKQTAEALLAKLTTRATFTEAQRTEILSWKSKPAQEPSATQSQSMDDFDKGLDASGDYVPE